MSDCVKAHSHIHTHLREERMTSEGERKEGETVETTPGDVVVAALDQGTSSTRVILFDVRGRVVFVHQVEVTQHTPAPGWVEEDAEEICATAETCLAAAASFAAARGLRVAALGVTNQRETTVAWDRTTGRPLSAALVWLDTRTRDLVAQARARMAGEAEAWVRARTGLPLATYFSAGKMAWLLAHVPAVGTAARAGRLALGTVDAWLLWRLTRGAVHATDVTNASRTLLMDLRARAWDPELCAFFGVPLDALPEIRSSSECYGRISVSPSSDSGPGSGSNSALAGTPFEDVPICGCLGDQQAALVGQLCLAPGRAKCTYGTGCFLLRHVGPRPVPSAHGLVATVAYQLGPHAPVHYALEGSVAVAGAAVQWLRDGLGLVARAADIAPLAASVPDTGGVCFVPAFSGLFAPHWRADARGCIVGLTQHTTRAHIARATLEATCFQALEVLQAMDKDAAEFDSGEGKKDDNGSDAKNAKTHQTELRVDGGMTANSLLLQLQADLLGLPVVCPAMRETTAFGAALAAGIAQGIWQLSPDGTTVLGITPQDTVYHPSISDEERAQKLERWKMAVERSLNWV